MPVCAIWGTGPLTPEHAILSAGKKSLNPEIGVEKRGQLVTGTLRYCVQH